MKCLITGATGLVGSTLCQKLLAQGHEVHFLTTKMTKLNTIPGAFGYYWNPAQGIIDENAFIGVDTIFHLAGESIAERWTASYKQAIMESRVLSATLLFKVLKENPHQVQHLISASGIGLYPSSEKELYAENSKSQDAGFVGQVVVKWEAAAERFNQIGIKTCLLRTGLVLDRHQGVLKEMEKPVKIGLGAALGRGTQYYSWIHIEDLANIYVFAAQHRLQGVFNAVAPAPETNREFTRLLAKTLNKPFFMPAVPNFILRLALGEMHALLLSSQKVSAEKILQAGFSFAFPKLPAALSNLYHVQ